MSMTTGLEAAPCLCGDASDGTIIPSIDPVLQDVWTYHRCPNCGLERLSPRPPIDAMSAHYSGDYTPYSDPAPQPGNRADQMKRMIYETYFAAPAERRAFVRRYRPLLAAALLPLRQHSVLSFRPPELPRRVFEFGAGTGADLMEFQAAGWHVSGCEPSGAAAGAAAALGIPLQVCNAEDATVPDGMSCVYMNNVFEHLHDPAGVLAKARHALVAGGIVVLIVPNHASWAARLFAGQWPGYDPPRHLWGFTPRSIRGVLERAGFAGVRVAQKFPLSTYCWAAGVEAWRGRPGGGSAARKRLVSRLGKTLLLSGMVAAAAGAADYMRVTARKP